MNISISTCININININVNINIIIDINIIININNMDLIKNNSPLLAFLNQGLIRVPRFELFWVYGMLDMI